MICINCKRNCEHLDKNGHIYTEKRFCCTCQELDNLYRVCGPCGQTMRKMKIFA